MTASNPIREALRHTVDRLIPAGHAYIIDVRGPRQIARKRSNCFQVVAETMEWPLRHVFDRYIWQGIPCFALRLGQDVEAAQRVIRLLLTDVYGYTTGTAFQCRIHDEGPLDSPGAARDAAATGGSSPPPLAPPDVPPADDAQPDAA